MTVDHKAATVGRAAMPRTIPLLWDEIDANGDPTHSEDGIVIGALCATSGRGFMMRAELNNSQPVVD
jgi:hypothetical protein